MDTNFLLRKLTVNFDTNPPPFEPISRMDEETNLVFFAAMKKAVANKYYKVIDALLGIGIKLTQIQLIETLKNATSAGFSMFIHNLLDEYPSTDFSFENSILLRIACTEGHFQTAEFLLNKGIILHISILEDAIKSGQYTIVQLFMKHGASLTEGNALSYLYTYCENSLDENYRKIFDYVHSWGELYKTARLCDGYGENEKRRFAIFQALDKAKTPKEISEIIKPLTQDEINWFNSSCLDGIVCSIVEIEYSKRKKQDIFQDLLRDNYIDTCKFYINKKVLSPNFNLAFAYVCQINRIESAKFLLQKGADIHWHCNLESASQNGCIEIVKLLIEKGIRIEEPSLYKACQNGYEKT